MGRYLRSIARRAVVEENGRLHRHTKHVDPRMQVDALMTSLGSSFGERVVLVIEGVDQSTTLVLLCRFDACVQ